MTTFWIDFDGYCFVEAENEEDARRIFWEQFKKIKDNDIMHEATLCIYSIENTEED